ncbi:hypothetical protein QTP88_006988 [Uroleucon formosanum]
MSIIFCFYYHDKGQLAYVQNRKPLVRVLLDKIKAQPHNTSLRELEKLIGTSKSVLSQLKNNEIAIREQYEKLNDNKSAPVNRKRKREGKDPEVDKALNEWFSAVAERGARISGSMLEQKAEFFAEKNGHKKSSADTNGVNEWSLAKLPEILKKFSSQDIYNADETGLFYRATPNGSLCYKRETLEGSKKAMDRITVLCCCNIAGTDKKKLLIIEKFVKPRCFKNIKITKLPVYYLVNKNVRMTREIFTSWLKDWDKELGKQSRKMLLIVDNAGPHPKLIDLKNIALEFLPPNTTSLVQPLDMGIIKNLKIHYRGLLVTYILKAIEDNLVTSSTCAIDISSKINIQEAIQCVADSWRKVSFVTIQHCFAHCGFRPLINLPIHPIISIENNVAQCVGNGELFIKIDDGVQCFNDNENYENILDEIAVRSLQNEESDDDDDDVQPVKITTREAEKCIDQLRLYFTQNENGNAPTTSLDVRADFIKKQSFDKLNQRTMDDFLQPKKI